MSLIRLPSLSVAALAFACFAISMAAKTAVAQEAPDKTDTRVLHYSHREYRIPMRDGVHLYTSVFSPDDETRSYPILMERTPYDAPNARPSKLYARSGYIFVFQSVRGRYQSEGSFIHMTPHKAVKSSSAAVDESTDTFDSIDWLVHRITRNNGRVGLKGISYPGFFAVAGMINAHPALKAVSPQAPQTDWFTGDDVHHRGAFMLSSMFGFVSSCMHRVDGSDSSACSTDGFDAGTKDGYEFFRQLGSLPNVESHIFRGAVPTWDEMMQHGTYDEYWEARNILPHIRDVRPAVLVVGGWYDANDFYGTLHVYSQLKARSAQAAATLVVGPWYHGQWSFDQGRRIDKLDFGSETSKFLTETLELPFFEHHLKGAPNPKLPGAMMFETGSNVWRRFDKWPPTRGAMRSLYLRENGGLAFEPPKSDGAAYDEYVSDPTKPVPYTPEMTVDMDPQYMARDQRFIRRRPDVLVYESRALESDVTLAGPVIPHLFVSTSGSDADWVVRLIDVYPSESPAYAPSAQRSVDAPRATEMSGFQLLVRGDLVRGKFRKSLSHPEPMSPGEVTSIDIPMDDILHTFKKGHRIVVQIQSTWFPLFDLNPHQFLDIYRARAQDFRPATQRVYRSADRPSQINVRVLKSE